MPALRNISLTQPPKRLGLQSPTTHGQENSWRTNADSPEYHNVKPERDDVTFSESSLSPSTSCSPSTFSDTPSSDSSYKGIRVRRRRRDNPNHIPRPRNAFFIFRSCYVNSHLGTTGQEPQNQLSKRAALVWHEMSGEEKTPFYEQALLEKDIHNFEYPDYVYTPVRNGNRTKNSKRAASTQNCSKREDQWSRYLSSESPSPSPGLLTPSPYLDLTSTSSLPDNDFVPTSEIPILELSPKDEVSAANMALPPSPFCHHLDSVTYHNGSQQYHRCDASDPTLPPLPRLEISGQDTVHSHFPASSLLCDNPYPSAHYLAAASALSYSSGYEGKHPHFMDSD